MRNSLLLFLFWTLFGVNAQTAGAEFRLFEPGKEDIVRYRKYGVFRNVGTEKYRYIIKDREGLALACGEGIFPNNSVIKDPAYRRLLRAGKLEGNHWDFINNKNHKINFYKWATAPEDPGVKLFYTGLMLERLGMYKEAVKAYYALVVHFPSTTSYTYWGSPFYMGPIAIDKIEIICRRNPGLGMKLEGARITVKNGFGLDTANDRFIVHPGKIVRIKPSRPDPKREMLSKREIVKSIGGREVRLVQYKNGHWQLLVHDNPYIIKGVAYLPNKVGLSPDRGTMDPTRDWQIQDFNKNGLIDGPYDSWVDKNRNNLRDPDEPVVGDARLLHEMGCNTLRIYSHVINKELFRDLYKKYQIRLMIGDLAGGYAIESGATWEDETDYRDPEQQEKMLGNIRKMVLQHKDEPYTLLWVLGNENVYGEGNNADEHPEAFFKFINRAARLIHELDPDHPVAISNGDLKFLNIMARYAPEVDIFGANCYRGVFGIGRSLFQNVKEMIDKPVIITEYGCSALAEGFTREESLNYQAEYHKNNWEDIYFHTAGSGVGNALGGVAFEWLDEWWKANADLPLKIQQQKRGWYEERSALYKNLQPEKHDAVPQFGAPFLDGWSYEEWYGLFSQGDGSHSPYLRQKRPVYDIYKEIWNKI